MTVFVIAWTCTPSPPATSIPNVCLVWKSCHQKDNLKKNPKKPKVILLILWEVVLGLPTAPCLPHFTHCLACSVCSSSGVWPRWAVEQYRHVSSLALWSLVEFGQWEGPAENKRQEKRKSKCPNPMHFTTVVIIFNGYSFSWGWGALFLSSAVTAWGNITPLQVSG